MAKASAAAHELLRIQLYVIDPPPGVAFAVQRGKADLLLPAATEKCALRFEFELRIGLPLSDGSFNFLGEFAQGTPSDRFVYLNSGIRADQPRSCWDRRAKIKLQSIPHEYVESVLAEPGRAVEARVNGTMKGGSPVCATVPPKMLAWRLLLN